MSTWYYYNEKGEKIAVTGGQLKGLAKVGRITPDTMVETEEGKTAPARRVKGLTFIAAQPQAAPPPPPVAPNPFTAIPPPVAANPFTAAPPVPANPFTAVPPSPPVAPNPFTATSPVPANPFTAAPPVYQASPESVPEPATRWSKKSAWFFTIMILVLIGIRLGIELHKNKVPQPKQNNIVIKPPIKQPDPPVIAQPPRNEPIQNVPVGARHVIP